MNFDFVEKYPIEKWEPYINFDKSKYKEKIKENKIIYTSLENNAKTIEVTKEKILYYTTIVYKENGKILDGFSAFRIDNSYNVLSSVSYYKNGKISSINNEPAILFYDYNKLSLLKWLKDDFVSNLEGPAIIRFYKDKIIKRYYINGCEVTEKLFYHIRKGTLNKNYKSINRIRKVEKLMLYKVFAEYFKIQEIIDHIDNILLVKKLEGKI